MHDTDPEIQTILAGWVHGTGPPATNCYVYNSTFYLLGDHGICTGQFENAALDTSVIHTIANNLTACQSAIGPGVKLADPATDSQVTAAAKAVLGEYPKPYTVE